MKLLHTSDWHLGRALYGKKRYQEYQDFLDWLSEVIEKENIDTLLIAGDIFDNGTPSNRAQELYYRFLCRVASSPCTNVIITAGNHDSPTFLSAPGELLKVLNVHVIGAITENIEDEILYIKDSQGTINAIICAVPYLRDRDIRKTSEAGETYEDKQKILLDGIRDHYKKVTDKAVSIRNEVKIPIPIIVMGHLFTTRGEVVDGDGVRELYVGSLAHVPGDIFSGTIDYVALGHLHVPQKVAGSEVCRYSGSPLPIGFQEAKQKKTVCVVIFENGTATVTLKEIPVFQKLESIRGNMKEIEAKISELAAADNSCWIEIIYTGKEVIGDLRQQCKELVTGTGLELITIKNSSLADKMLSRDCPDETLDDLSVQDVFLRCLDKHEVPQDQRQDLVAAFHEAVLEIEQKDSRAE